MTINLKKNDGVLDPPPTEIDLTTGKKCWEIQQFKIWANTYQEALEMLPLIQDNYFTKQESDV